MNTKILITVFICLSVQMVYAQKYYSKTGNISFYSDTDIEKIEAHNSSASTVIDVTTGAIEWGVLIQGFKFAKSLMQDHFNENYMESSKYPKAKFKGVIEDCAKVDFTKDGNYDVQVSGQLEIHGVSQKVRSDATIMVQKGQVSAKSNFTVLIADYGIKVPKLVEENISDEVTIKLSADYMLLK